MISPYLLYVKFLPKVNKSSTFSNRSIDIKTFVLLFNEVKDRWVERVLKDKDSIDIDTLFELVTESQLLNYTDFPERQEFQFGDDFYEVFKVEGICEKGGCKKNIFFRQIKNQDKAISLFNTNLQPDFEFEWSFFSIGNKKIQAFKKDFKILDLRVEYYKKIPNIDIQGYIHLDGTPSTNKGLDLSEQFADQILNLCAEEYMRNIENPQGLQLSKDRTINQQ